MKFPFVPGIGIPFRRQRRFMRRGRPAPVASRIVGGLGLLVVIGTLLLLLPGVGTRRPLSISEALFTATSALSVTGLSVIVPSQDLTMFGQIILLLLIQIGGIGFMVMAVVVFWVMGRKLSLINRLALSDSLGLMMPGAIVKLTRRVIVTVLTVEGIGAVALWLHWREELGDARAVFYAIFHAVSSFCNAGFDLFNGLAEYPAGIPNDNTSLLIMAGLIFVGGLGIPVLSDILNWPQNRMSLHTRITFVVVVSLICAGGLGMFLAERSNGGVLADEPWSRQLLLAFFQSISARTAGFAGIQPFEAISPASQLLLTVLMFIGAAPASMGGGITTGTFAVLSLALWGYARGQSTAHVGGRSIAPAMVHKAAAVLTISLFVVLFAAWLILITHHTATLDIVMFEVVSAFATCGLSLGMTSDLNLFGKLIIVLVMFWGRLGALTIIVALAAQTRSTQLVSYPEEKILIG